MRNFGNFLDMIKKSFWTQLKKTSSDIIIIYQIFQKPPPSRIPAYITGDHHQQNYSISLNRLADESEQNLPEARGIHYKTKHQKDRLASHHQTPRERH